MDRPCIQPVAISYASCPLLLFTRFLLQYFNTTACLRSNFNVKVGSHLFSFHCLHWDHPLPIGSHLLAMTSSQTASLLSPWIPSLRSTLKTADRNPLARCESDHASLLLKTHPGHPISPGAKASLVTSTNLVVSVFLSDAPLSTLSAPAVLLCYIRGHRAFALADAPACSPFSQRPVQPVPSFPSGIYLLKCHFSVSPALHKGQS